MKIFLINDGRLTSNWGLQASTQALLDLFETFGAEVTTLTHFDLHKVYAWDPYFFGKRVFNQSSRFLKQFSPLSLLIPFTADQYDTYVDQWKKGLGGVLSSDIIAKIDESDFVVFNAEGSTYRKNHGALSGLFILYYAAVVHKKKALFANGSFTITKIDNVLSAISNKLYAAGVNFYVREPLSAECLKSNGIQSKVVPDSVFYFSNLSRSTDKNRTFSVSKSMLPMCNFKNIQTDPFYQLISRISDKTSLAPVFYGRDPEDQMIKKYISEIPGSSAGIFSSNDFKNVQESISRSQFLLSGRYHHLIFAANSKTKICALSSSSHKNEGLLNLLYPSLDIPCFDPTDISTQMSIIVDYCSDLHNNKSDAFDVDSLRYQFIHEYTHYFESVT